MKIKLKELRMDDADWHATNELERVSVDLSELRSRFNQLIDYLLKKELEGQKNI